jgi:hypothetical protein
LAIGSGLVVCNVRLVIVSVVYCYCGELAVIFSVMEIYDHVASSCLSGNVYAVETGVKGFYSGYCPLRLLLFSYIYAVETDVKGFYTCCVFWTARLLLIYLCPALHLLLVLYARRESSYFVLTPVLYAGMLGRRVLISIVRWYARKNSY